MRTPGDNRHSFQRSAFAPDDRAMRVEPFSTHHLASLKVQPHQRAWREHADSADLACLNQGRNRGWTAFDGEAPVAMLGVIDMGGGRAMGWGLISAEAGRVFPALHRAVTRFLLNTDYRRIEAVTASDFQPARRWAEMLGFTHEGTMRAYCHDGSDAELWARVG